MRLRSLRLALPLALSLATSLLASGLGCGPAPAPAAHSASSAPVAATVSAATPTPPPPRDDLPEVPPDPRERQLAEAAVFLLSQKHVLQQPIDDGLSQKAMDKLVEHLDGAKLLLLEEHVTTLRRHAISLDDQLLRGDMVAARKAVALAAERRKIAAKIVAELLAAPLDLSQPESYETDPDKRAFAKTEAELRDRWRGTLKLQLLERLVEMEELLAQKDDPRRPLDEQAKKALAKIPATPAEREAQARKEIATRYETRFVRMNKLNKLDAAELFLNAVAAAIDPHTQYLVPSEKENFDVAMTGRLEGIGAALREQDHYIVVESLVPGGASWQQGKLAEGDVILAVAQEGKDPVDVMDMPIDEVVRMIRGPKGTIVTLTVRKADGRVEAISIQRDVIKIEATYARGAVLDHGPKGDEAGYVYLPGFYGEVSSPRGGPPERNATGDVRALLETFRRKKIGRVVLDLRGNGGGLLAHARDISGLFLERGPVVQTRDSDGAIDVLSDEDPSVAFGGEVVVMVDRFSASASEILAAALQDHRRAVVVGTGPTHGKGTVQAVLDLDRIARGGGDPLGVLKLTVEMYYRVDGASVQQRGVTPDVVLADPASFVESGERTLDHAIPWSSIPPARFTPLSPPWSPRAIAEASRARAEKDAVFAQVVAHGRRVAERRKDTVEPLEEKAYRERRKRSKAELDALDPKLDELKPRLDVQPIADPSVSAATAADPKVKKQIEEWRAGLARDPWLAEALFVLDDMRQKR